MLVLVWHFVACQLLDAPANSWVATLRNSLYLTWSGVDLFFVLSGFLITGVLLDHRSAPNCFRVFYIRRACRILPLYYLLIIIFVLLGLLPNRTGWATWLLSDPMPLWTYAVFIQNIFMGIAGSFGAFSLGVTWSLAVEEQFYLVIPLLIFFFRPKATGLVLLAVAVTAPFLRLASPGFHAFVNTPWRADSLLSGACLAFSVRNPGFLIWVRSNPRWMNVLLLILFAIAIWISLRPQWPGEFRHTWLAALYSVLILVGFTQRDSYVASALRTNALVWLGVRSYGIYMFHQTISGLFHGLAHGGSPAMRALSDVSITAAALLATLALAAISYRWLEMPLLRFGQRFQYRMPHEVGKPCR